MSVQFHIGIDLGGTKIEGAAIDNCGSIQVRRRIVTPVQDYRATISAIITLIRGIEQEIGAKVYLFGSGSHTALAPGPRRFKRSARCRLVVAT
jgi:fructokinase